MPVKDVKQARRFLSSFALAASLMSLASCAEILSIFSPPPSILSASRVQYRTHTVRHGETLAVIAERYTGAAMNWKRIQGFNPGLDVLKMKAGDKVKIPLDLMTKSARAGTGTKTPSSRGGAGSGTRQPPLSGTGGPNEIEMLPMQQTEDPFIDLPPAAIKDPAAPPAADPWQDYDPEPFDADIDPGGRRAPPRAAPTPDPHKAEEEKLKKRYEVLMDILENQE